MKMNRNGGFALLLIACGALILMHKVGFHFGYAFHHIMEYVFPAAMVVLGYIGVKNGRFFGWLLLAIGGIVLLGKLSWLIGVVIAVGMIGYGISLLRNRKTV